jgi:hypothetical protein
MGGFGVTGDSRVVDQDMKLAELLIDIGKGLLDLFCLGNVHMPEFGCPAGGFNFFSYSFTVFVVDIHDGNLGAFFSQDLGGSFPDSRSPAGNDSYLTLDSIHCRYLNYFLPILSKITCSSTTQKKFPGAIRAKLAPSFISSGMERIASLDFCQDWMSSYHISTIPSPSYSMPGTSIKWFCTYLFT